MDFYKDSKLDFMEPAILSLGLGVPSFSSDQAEIGAHMIDRMRLDEDTAWAIEKIYRNSQIERRYSVLPHLLWPEKTGAEFGMSERNEIYKREAPLLAEKAARQALEAWGRPPQEITHILSVSCTGAITPGIEFKLSQALKLPSSTNRLGINFMGCFGAFKGLSVARNIAKADAKHRVLLVCTELCTLHFKSALDVESIVIQSLFADGSAAAIIGADCKNGESPLYEIVDEDSLALPDSEQEMTWDAGSHGFSMTLSAKVPELIAAHIAPFAKKLLPGSVPVGSLDCPIHPGGRAIVEAAEKALGLEKNQTQASWNVLKKYGNLSSATFLFVLQELLSIGPKQKHSLGIGFGPGLSMEAILLRNMRQGA